MKPRKVIIIGEKSEEKKIYDDVKLGKIGDLNDGMVIAAKNNNYDFVQKFIDLGANDYSRALNVCFYNNSHNYKIINLLLSNSAKLDMIYVDENNCEKVLSTILSIIYDYGKSSNVYIYLINTCIYLINTYNTNCKHIRITYIKSMLENGLDINRVKNSEHYNTFKKNY